MHLNLCQIVHSSKFCKKNNELFYVKIFINVSALGHHVRHSIRHRSRGLGKLYMDKAKRSIDAEDSPAIGPNACTAPKQSDSYWITCFNYPSEV